MIVQAVSVKFEIETFRYQSTIFVNMEDPYDVQDIIKSAFLGHGVEIGISCLGVNYKTEKDVLKVEYEYDLYLEEQKDYLSVEMILEEVREYISSHISLEEEYDLVLICNLR